MDLLEAELQRLGPRGAKFIYTIPNFQNPAGVTLTPERRRRLARAGARVRHPASSRTTRTGGCASRAGTSSRCARSTTRSSTSARSRKIFAPGLRLGWMIAPRPILAQGPAREAGGRPVRQRVRAGRPPSGTSRAPAGASVLAGPHAHVRRAPRRDARRARRALPGRGALDASRGRLLRVGRAARRSSTRSRCSPRRSSAASRTCPATRFYPDGRGRNCMRLAFCYAEPDEIREGVRRLAEVLEDRLELYRAFVAAGALPGAQEGVCMRREDRGAHGRPFARARGVARERPARVRCAHGARLPGAGARRDARPRRDAARASGPTRATSRCTASTARTAPCRSCSSSSASRTPGPAWSSHRARVGQGALQAAVRRGRASRRPRG